MGLLCQIKWLRGLQKQGTNISAFFVELPRCVFDLDLKVSTVAAHQISSGSWFQLQVAGISIYMQNCTFACMLQWKMYISLQSFFIAHFQYCGKVLGHYLQLWCFSKVLLSIHIYFSLFFLRYTQKVRTQYVHKIKNKTIFKTKCLLQVSRYLMVTSFGTKHILNFFCGDWS